MRRYQLRQSPARPWQPISFGIDQAVRKVAVKQHQHPSRQTRPHHSEVSQPVRCQQINQFEHEINAPRAARPCGSQLGGCTPLLPPQCRTQVIGLASRKARRPSVAQTPRSPMTFLPRLVLAPPPTTRGVRSLVFLKRENRFCYASRFYEANKVHPTGPPLVRALAHSKLET